MIKALIHDNKVVQLTDKEFPVHGNLRWLDAPEGCEVGWKVNAEDTIYKPRKKKRSYQLERQDAYPSIGDQLDAILKQLQQETNLVVELEDIINKWLNVKQQFPKR